MKPPADVPEGLIPVTLGKSCVLLLTQPEFAAGVRRGKIWRRRLENDRREAQIVPQEAARESQQAGAGGRLANPPPSASLPSDSPSPPVEQALEGLDGPSTRARAERRDEGAR